MKILHVTEAYSPLHGGSAEVPFQLARQLAGRGHEVTVYTSDHQLTRDYLDTASGVTVRTFRTWSSLANFYFTPGMAGAARKTIRDFDVVHLHNFRTFQNIVFHRHARRAGVPYVLSPYGSLARVMGKQAVKRLYDAAWGYRVIRDAARLIATQPTEAAQFVELGGDKAKIVQIPNSLKIEDYDKLPPAGSFREKFGVTEDHLVLFLGRIAEIKGLDILAKATAGLVREGLSVRLVIAGPDGGYREALDKLIAQLGFGANVLFTGFITAEDKLAAYVDADVYVLPSWYESFGITVLESAACGTPVILTENCQIAGLVKDVFGLVVQYDENDLQRALLELLTDEDLRQRLGEKGRSVVREDYTWERCLRQTENVYEEVVKRHA